MGKRSDPVVTVGAFLLNAEGQFLLGLRAEWKKTWANHWDVVGGHVEPEETIEHALIREVSEETGVVPTSFEWIAAWPERRPDIHGNALHHLYLVTAWQGGEPRNICDEHSELRWFCPAELPDIPNLVDDAYIRLALRCSGRKMQ